MGEGIWKKEVGKNASVKDLGPCHRVEKRIHTKKGKKCKHLWRIN